MELRVWRARSVSVVEPSAAMELIDEVELLKVIANEKKTRRKRRKEAHNMSVIEDALGETCIGACIPYQCWLTRAQRDLIRVASEHFGASEHTRLSRISCSSSTSSRW